MDCLFSTLNIMSLAYYSNEIPIAKRFIRNYLVYRCTEEENAKGRLFIWRLRDTWRYFIKRATEDLFRESYKQYLLCMDHFGNDLNTVSPTVFKRLLAKERRTLYLVRGLVKDKEYQYSISNTMEVVDLLERQERSEDRL